MKTLNLKQQAEKIYLMHIKKEKKIKLLKELIFDCYNEMEAQNENMHPEIQHNVGEGLRLAKNCLRKLR